MARRWQAVCTVFLRSSGSKIWKLVLDPCIVHVREMQAPYEDDSIRDARSDRCISRAAIQRCEDPGLRYLRRRYLSKTTECEFLVDSHCPVFSKISCCPVHGRYHVCGTGRVNFIAAYPRPETNQAALPPPVDYLNSLSLTTSPSSPMEVVVCQKRAAQATSMTDDASPVPTDEARVCADQGCFCHFLWALQLSTVCHLFRAEITLLLCSTALFSFSGVSTSTSCF